MWIATAVKSRGKGASTGAPFISQCPFWEDWGVFPLLLFFLFFPLFSLFLLFNFFFFKNILFSPPPPPKFLFCWVSFSFFSSLSKSDPSQGSSSFRRWQNLTSLLSWIHCWDIWALQLCPKAKSNSLALCGFPLGQRKEGVISELGVISC